MSDTKRLKSKFSWDFVRFFSLVLREKRHCPKDIVEYSRFFNYEIIFK